MTPAETKTLRAPVEWGMVPASKQEPENVPCRCPRLRLQPRFHAYGLHRHTPYQHQYQALASAREDTAPLPVEDQRRWGLRFPGATESVCARANHLLVAGRRAVRADVCVHT
ncbi:transcriptional regulator domain-containing protein [Afipia felis]|uniref:transcriptional regulator domain-containing protein n=1 Tax=Afipia felis TaxID=1035 RepID=UPI003D9BDA61